jgi:hypothetical protein
MRPVAKLGIIAAGYTTAFAAALIAVQLYILATPGVDRQTYSGMSAFGDSLVFLAALGAGSLPATGAVLYFLRPHNVFWRWLCIVVLALVLSSIASLTSYAVPGFFDALIGRWSDLAPLRILVSPIFALFFLLSAIIAPNRSTKIFLLVASVVELAVFTFVILMWFHTAEPHLFSHSGPTNRTLLLRQDRWVASKA